MQSSKDLDISVQKTSSNYWRDWLNNSLCFRYVHRTHLLLMEQRIDRKKEKKNKDDKLRGRTPLVPKPPPRPPQVSNPWLFMGGKANAFTLCMVIDRTWMNSESWILVVLFKNVKVLWGVKIDDVAQLTQNCHECICWPTMTSLLLAKVVLWPLD